MLLPDCYTFFKTSCTTLIVCTINSVPILLQRLLQGTTHDSFTKVLYLRRSVVDGWWLMVKALPQHTWCRALYGAVFVFVCWGLVEGSTRDITTTVLFCAVERSVVPWPEESKTNCTAKAALVWNFFYLKYILKSRIQVATSPVSECFNTKAAWNAIYFYNNFLVQNVVLTLIRLEERAGKCL